MIDYYEVKMQSLNAYLLLVCCISVHSSHAFFGLSINGYYAPSSTIATSCSNTVTAYNSLRSAISSLRNEPYVSLNLRIVSDSFFVSYDGLGSRMQNVFAFIQNAANNKTATTDNLFVQINNSISSALDFIATNNRTEWEKILDPSLLQDFTTTNASLRNISQILNEDIYPKLISIGQGSVTPSTVAASIPQTVLNSFTTAIDQLRQTEQTTVLPSVRTAVSALQTSNQRFDAYISKMLSSYATLDTSLSQCWTSTTSLPDTFTTTTNRLYAPVNTSVNTFIKAINSYTDLYLGSSASDNTAAVNFLASSYFNNASSQTSMVVTKLDQFRSQYSEQVLSTTSVMLTKGFEVMQSVAMSVIQQTKLPSCAGQLTQSFIDRYSALLSSLQNCFTGGNFDLNPPLQTQMSVASNIQADILYYLTILNGLLTGVTDGSTATARIAADSRVTAFFSQSAGIIRTFSQQLVNMFVQLNADYNLIVGRSSYCLASKAAEATSMVDDFGSAFQLCLES
ncbi:uncharacterized protein LOC115258059 [Aedes albopictus]|uniref:Uncharacterized protein n=1 Tax=Aedes albopictus TaxID=7160 RepID=A0ABM1ZIC4_AEDAL